MKQDIIHNTSNIGRQPLVSVIIPNYNHARYLDQRLQSVLGQTYPNFEVIILDDKSTDNSLEVIAKYQNDPHVSQVVVNEQNSGNTFKQWDKGIHLAKGDIIWIAESDDYCELNLLEELVKAYVQNENTVLAYNSTLVLYDDGYEGNRLYIGPNQYMTGKRYLRNYLTLFNWVMNASCAIFSKQAAQSIRPDYKAYKGAGDYLFWAEIANQGNIAIVNKRLSYFCRHAGTVTSMKELDGTNPKECKKVLDYIESKVHIAWWRKRIVFNYHKGWHGHHNYLNDSIYDELNAIWHFDKYNTLFDRFIARSAQYLRRHFNYYL